MEVSTDIKQFVKNKRLASFRVQEWIGTYTKVEISNMLSISRPTLDKRLEKHNWRMKELLLIQEKMPY